MLKSFMIMLVVDSNYAQIFPYHLYMGGGLIFVLLKTNSFCDVFVCMNCAYTSAVKYMNM